MKRRGDDDENNGPKEAKLDDIIYNYSGVEAIRVSGPNTPNHVMKAYRELCELRHKRGEFFDSDPLCSSEQIDNETKDCINNECFSFIQSLLSRWNTTTDYSSTFGGRQSVRDDGVVINVVVNAPQVCRSFFQQKWSNLLKQIQKMVEKNIKSKKKLSCACTNNNHPINELLVLITTVLHKETIDFLVSWYVDCSHYCCAPLLPPSIRKNDEAIKWPGYEKCEEKYDVITNEIDERMRMLMSPSHTPSSLMMIPPLLVPKQFSHLELRPSLWLDIIIMHDDDNDMAYDGYHSLSGVDDDLTLVIFIFCSRGYNKNCNHPTCHKIDRKRDRKFKKKRDGIEKDCVFLTKWPFPHAPVLNDELKCDIISSTTTNDELNADSCSWCEVNVKFVEHQNFVRSFLLSPSFLKK